MSNEIVKFSNQFNNVALKKFDAVHLDVLMAIASRVRRRARPRWSSRSRSCAASCG